MTVTGGCEGDGAKFEAFRGVKVGSGVESARNSIDYGVGRRHMIKKEHGRDATRVSIIAEEVLRNGFDALRRASAERVNARSDVPPGTMFQDNDGVVILGRMIAGVSGPYLIPNNERLVWSAVWSTREV